MDSLAQPANNEPVLIGVTGCRKRIDGQDFDAAGHRYIQAIGQACGAVPLIIPTLGTALDRKALLSRIDGLLFTGSRSNVEPHHYHGPGSDPGTLHDPHRDATTLPLIREAAATAVPIFGICRGFQEFNVAYGGTLHQKVREQPGMFDHQVDPDDPVDIKFSPVHDIEIRPGGIIAGLTGAKTVSVNSLHGQGIETLAQGLRVEAVSPDGLIEAVSVKDAKTFALAVQWHPEWRVMDNAFYLPLFTAFATACRAHLREHQP